MFNFILGYLIGKSSSDEDTHYNGGVSGIFPRIVFLVIGMIFFCIGRFYFNSSIVTAIGVILIILMVVDIFIYVINKCNEI